MEVAFSASENGRSVDAVLGGHLCGARRVQRGESAGETSASSPAVGRRKLKRAPPDTVKVGAVFTALSIRAEPRGDERNAAADRDVLRRDGDATGSGLTVVLLRIESDVGRHRRWRRPAGPIPGQHREHRVLESCVGGYPDLACR